ncbi:MAG: HD domain-containing protein [Firmicutes bacterium]|nr:HD domain-containing protein [Bacillota bacterium]
MSIRDTFLIGADVAENRQVLRQVLENNFNIFEVEDYYQAMVLLRQNFDCIGGILLDIEQDGKGASNLLRLMRISKLSEQIPVIMILSPKSSLTEEMALDGGAADVIIKPCSSRIILQRVRLLADLFNYRWNLEMLVEEQARKLRQTNENMVDVLSSIIEHRSAESGQHVRRIRGFTRILLEDVAENWPEYGLDERIIEMVSSASVLHDIGKISVPDAILNKPGRLTEEEFEAIKKHTIYGANMVETLVNVAEKDYLRYAYNICRFHHERWDGKGYPDRLKGEEIPICAQVVGVADVYDALTTPRVYKEAYSPETAVRMILNGECGTFSPKVLECFQNVKDAFADLAVRYADGVEVDAGEIAQRLEGPAATTRTLSTAERVQRKYQTLLHYIDATIIEAELESGVFRLIYNSNPDFTVDTSRKSIHDIASVFEENRIHPDDRETFEREIRFCQNRFFKEGLRRHTVYCHTYRPSMEAYHLFEFTMLRVELNDDKQNVILICRPAPENMTHTVNN